MSDYERNKQVLYPVTKELLEKLNCNDIYDIEEKFPAKSNFTIEGFVDYSGTKNYNRYLAYELDSNYGVDYCYYNCCEADDYYVKKDSFEEEI